MLRINPGCRSKLAIAALVVLAFPSLAFNGSCAADYAGPIHTDEQLRRLTDYQGPVRSDRILRAWREQFLGQRFNRAIAITEVGGWGTVWARKTPEDAMDDALRNCRAARSPENLIHECHLYAVNNAVVYPGREYELPKLKVDFGSFSLREDYFFYGPQRSKGVIVWSHGTAHDCVEARGTAAWSFITRFNLDGWDVLRFDRDPCFDTMPRALSQIATSILQLRDVGYRRIVLAGQSRGAWQSLELLSVPGIAQYVSAIIAVSPARHGTKFTYVTEQGWADWAFLIDHLDAPRVAIALIFFPQDEFIPDARKRAAYGAAALAQKGNPYMIVYEEEGGITGHAGGGNARFTEKYSLCLTQFVNSGGRDRLCGTTGLPAGR